MSNLNIGLVDIAHSLGENIVSNVQLKEEHPDWDMDQVFQRTGVRSRPIAAPGETALSMAIKATEKLFEKIKIERREIGALIFCTQTPDHILPPNSSLLHGQLGLPDNMMTFDINHACSGFIYAVGIARGLIQSGVAKNTLIVTADTYSRLIHPQDRSTLSLFGDGAASTLISVKSTRLNILDMSFGSSGKNAGRFIVKNGGMKSGRSVENVLHPDASGRINSPDHIYMDGMGVLSFFTSAIPPVVRGLLAKNNKLVEDIDFFVFHQASSLALNGLRRALKIPEEKMIIDLEDTGNLVSASIPVALERLLERDVLKRGQLVVLCGFGVGLSWGVTLLEVQ
jgi:3-oxoacyl-[acyl-carrier-protein] synthase III